jgi:hypothetical protein
MKTQGTRYDQIIEAILLEHYRTGVSDFHFERDKFIGKAETLGLERPRNLGDLLYTYRYRKALPLAIKETAPPGYAWIIRGAGHGRYQFALVRDLAILPDPAMLKIKIPDATPGVISKYAMSDEQALLAKLRYNRLIDIFTGLTCYSLQSHLRTTVKGVGQVETDELYIGLDKRGAHTIIPVQAKGGRDKIGAVQIEQDMAMCVAKFPDLICRPVAAQFVDDGVIALFEFVDAAPGEIAIASQRHYRLVKPEDLSPDEQKQYQHLQF